MEEEEEDECRLNVTHQLDSRTFMIKEKEVIEPGLTATQLLGLLQEAIAKAPIIHIDRIDAILLMIGGIRERGGEKAAAKKLNDFVQAL